MEGTSGDVGLFVREEAVYYVREPRLDKAWYTSAD